jgi:hypothetical protein
MSPPLHYRLLERSIPVQAVLEWAVEDRKVDRLLLSARIGHRQQRRLAAPETLTAVRTLFGDRVLETWVTSEWPVTMLIDGHALIFVVAFDDRLIGPMAKAGPTFGDWNGFSPPRPLPEDLCLFRQGDEWPSVISVTHEVDAWILTSGEKIEGLPQYGPVLAPHEAIISRDRPIFLPKSAYRASTWYSP